MVTDPESSVASKIAAKLRRGAYDLKPTINTRQGYLPPQKSGVLCSG